MVNILFKTTSKCNANCSYCFDKINQDTPVHHFVMPIEDFETMFDYICDNWGSDIQWCWHGGEPLLARREWFSEALFFMHKKSRFDGGDIHFFMQTNGTLFNEKWQELFDKYNIDYSVSNDGLLNDKTRRYPEVHTSEYMCSPAQLGVISPITIDHLIENYEHMKKEKCIESYTENWGFPAPGQTVQEVWGSEEDIDHAIDKYFEYIKYYIYDQDHPLVNRDVLDFISGGLGFQPSTCIFTNCFASDMICINTEGDVFKCDEIDNPDFYLGHYTDFKTYDDIFKSPILSDHLAKKEKWKETYCKDCDCLGHCSQGCWARASRESNGEHPYSLMCRLSKRMLPKIYEELGDLTPAQFAKLNPYVQELLLKNLYIPASMKEEAIKKNGNNNIQTNTPM